MNLSNMLDNPGSFMTVLSLITFLGIVWWTFRFKRKTDFDEAARLPFSDDPIDSRSVREGERHHG